MKWSNEELVSIKEEVEGDIQCAIGELNGVEEYREVLTMLLDAKNELNNLAEPYGKLYEEECEREKEYKNMEYVKGAL